MLEYLLATGDKRYLLPMKCLLPPGKPLTSNYPFCILVTAILVDRQVFKSASSVFICHIAFLVLYYLFVVWYWFNVVR